MGIERRTLVKYKWFHLNLKVSDKCLSMNIFFIIIHHQPYKTSRSPLSVPNAVICFTRSGKIIITYIPTNILRTHNRHVNSQIFLSHQKVENSLIYNNDTFCLLLQIGEMGDKKDGREKIYIFKYITLKRTHYWAYAMRFVCSTSILTLFQFYLLFT